MSIIETSQVGALLQGLSGGGVEIVDLTQPLTESTPVIKLPPPFANTPGLSRAEISHYRDRGPAAVINKTAQAEADPGYLLTVADIEAWEAEHGELPERCWVLFRTGWQS